MLGGNFSKLAFGSANTFAFPHSASMHWQVTGQEVPWRQGLLCHHLDRQNHVSPLCMTQWDPVSSEFADHKFATGKSQLFVPHSSRLLSSSLQHQLAISAPASKSQHTSCHVAVAIQTSCQSKQYLEICCARIRKTITFSVLRNKKD